MIQPGKYLFIIGLLLFARISNAQQEYWPGMPRIHQENTFFHLGKFIIHQTWMNQTYDGYYISNDGGKTWRKLNEPLFSARNIFSITTLDSFFLIHAINGYYLTTDFVNYTFAGDPKHIEISRMVAANTVNKEIIGYKCTWLQAPQVTSSEQKVWFVSADGGFNWNVISGGLLTTRKSYVTGVAGEMPVYGDYYDVNMPSSFIGTKTDYLATYTHDFLPSNAKADLVKFNFFSRQWETIIGTNYYTDVAKKDAEAQLCHYNPKTENVFIYDGISKLFYSQNLGTTWLPCGSGLPTGTDYHALKLFSRADTLFAVVITKNSKYQYLPGLYYSLNNGMFFDPIPLNLPKGIELDGVTVSKEGYIIFTSKQCECAFIQEPGSYTFNERAIPSTNKSPVTHLQVLNETEVLAQYRPDEQQVDQGQETYGGISHTTDKGLTWTNVTRNLSNFGIKDWVFFHDTLLVITPYARFTTDWGKTWAHLPGVDSMETFGAINFIDSFIYIGGGGYSNNGYRSKNMSQWEKHKTSSLLFDYNYPLPKFFGIMFNGKYWSADDGVTLIPCQQPIRGEMMNAIKLPDSRLLTFYYFGLKNMPTYYTAISADSGKIWKDTVVATLSNMKGCYLRDTLLYFLTNSAIKVLNTNTLEIIKEYPFKFKLSLTNKIFYHNGKIYVPTSDELGKIYVWNDELVTSNQSNVSDEPEIQLYPNPATNRLTIELNHDQKKLTYQLFNVVGTPVMSGLIYQNAVLDLTSIPAGLYFLRISGSDSEHIHKVLVSK